MRGLTLLFSLWLFSFAAFSFAHEAGYVAESYCSFILGEANAGNWQGFFDDLKSRRFKLSLSAEEVNTEKYRSCLQENERDLEKGDFILSALEAVTKAESDLEATTDAPTPNVQAFQMRTFNTQEFESEFDWPKMDWEATFNVTQESSPKIFEASIELRKKNYETLWVSFTESVLNKAKKDLEKNNALLVKVE